MSDNPNSEDLANIGVSYKDDGVDLLIQQLSTIKELGVSVSESIALLSQSSADANDKIQQIDASFSEALSKTSDFSDDIEKLSATFDSLGGSAESSIAPLRGLLETWKSFGGDTSQSPSAFIQTANLDEQLTSLHDLINTYQSVEKASDSFRQVELQSKSVVEAFNAELKDLSVNFTDLANKESQAGIPLRGLQATFTEFYGETEDGSIRAEAAMQDEMDRINELANAFREEQSAIEASTAAMDAQNAELQALQQSNQELQDASRLANQNAIGYGASGGLIGPSESGGDLGDIGNVTAIARGVRSAGGFAGIFGADSGVVQGATGGADILFFAQGLKQLGQVIPQLNAALESTPNIATGAAEALTELGLPVTTLGLVAGVAIPVVIGLGLEIATFAKTIKDGEDAIKKANDQKVEEYKLEATATTDDINQKIEAQNIIKKANIEALADNRRVLRSQIVDALTATKRDVNEVSIAKLSDQVQQGNYLNVPIDRIAGIQFLVSEIKRLGDDSNTAQAKIDILNNGLNSTQVAANDAATNAAKFSAAVRDQQNADIARAAQFASDDKMTADSAQNRITALNADVIAQQGAIAAIKDVDQNTALSTEEHQKNADAIAAHQTAMQEDGLEITHLTDVSLPLIQARQDEKDAIKELEKAEKERIKSAQDAIDSLQKQADTYHDSIAAATRQLASQTADAKAREIEAEKQYLQGSLQDIHERNAIAAKEDQAELKLQQDTANAITDAQVKLNNDKQKLTVDLNRQQQDDSIKYADDLAKLQRKEYDQEQQDKVDHLEKIAELNRNADKDERHDLLDRNFLKFLEDKENAQESIRVEESSNTKKIAQTRSNLQTQERELTIADAELRAHQQLEYQRKFADQATAEHNQETLINQHEQQKLAVLRANETQQINDLVSNETYKRQLLQQGLQADLALYRQHEQDKITLATQTAGIIATIEGVLRNPLVQLASRFGSLAGQGLSSLFNQSSVQTFASGGSFGAGTPFEMSEGGVSESLNIGSGSYMIPGAAMVYPLQSGSVNNRPSSKSITLAPVFQITGSNPQQIVDLIMPRVEALIGEVTGT